MLTILRFTEPSPELWRTELELLEDDSAWPTPQLASPLLTSGGRQMSDYSHDDAATGGLPNLPEVEVLMDRLPWPSRMVCALTAAEMALEIWHAWSDEPTGCPSAADQVIEVLSDHVHKAPSDGHRSTLKRTLHSLRHGALRDAIVPLQHIGWRDRHPNSHHPCVLAAQAICWAARAVEDWCETKGKRFKDELYRMFKMHRRIRGAVAGLIRATVITTRATQIKAWVMEMLQRHKLTIPDRLIDLWIHDPATAMMEQPQQMALSHLPRVLMISINGSWIEAPHPPSAIPGSMVVGQRCLNRWWSRCRQRLALANPAHDELT